MISAVTERKTITIRFLHQNGKVNQTEFNNERGVPLFRTNIGDEPVCALLDTAAEASVVGLDVADRAGLAIFDPKGDLIGLNGTTKSYLINAVPIEIPGQLAFQRDMVGAILPDYTCPDETKLGFILGMDFLGKMAVYLDNVRRRMILLPAGQITPTEGLYERFDWSGGEVDGAIEGVPVSFKVDHLRFLSVRRNFRGSLLRSKSLLCLIQHRWPGALPIRASRTRASRWVPCGLWATLRAQQI